MSGSAFPTLVSPVQLFQGSSERMHQLRNGSVDLIVTSPPYFMPPTDTYMEPAFLRTVVGTGKDRQRIAGTYESLLVVLDRCFAECYRVLKPGGFLAVNVASTRVGGKLYPLPFDLTVRLLAGEWELAEEFVWRRWRGYDKRAGTLIQKPYPGYFFPNRTHEHLLLLKKPGPPIYKNRSDTEKETSRLALDRLYVLETANSVWNILPVTPSEKGLHPCPFPEELPARIIELYSYRGETVLDPFLGSGTTGKAARHLGRRFIGYEINPQFLELARNRIHERTLHRERRAAQFETIPAR